MKAKLFYFLLFAFGITYGQYPTNGLIAQYEFINGSFTDAISSANLTQNGTALTQITDRLSNATNAISLNGDYLTRSNLSSGNDITYSFWVKTSANTNDLKTIIDDSQKNSTNNNFSGSQIGYTIMLQNGKIFANFRMQHRARFTSAQAYSSLSEVSSFIADNNWHHVVVQFKSYNVGTNYSGLISIHIDGSLSNKNDSRLGNAGTVPLFDSSGDVAIANNRNNTINANLRYNDIVDDIFIYNRELTAQEIMNISSTVRATRTTYVNAFATGNNDGTSWANAYADLQVALSTSIPGDVIWVAKGTYKPHASDRNTSFIFQNNIYGGFAGTETTLADRDMSLIHTTNATILSGDLSANDDATVDFNDATRTDNSKHIVEINANNLEVNGFTIQNGYADATSGDDRFGSGIFKETTVPNLTVKNCNIKNNVALAGAGLALTATSDSNITIDACTIENNLANAGAGLDYHLSGSSAQMNIVITNCLFNNNKTDDDVSKSRKGVGAAAARLRAFFSSVTLDATIVNNTFVNNSCLGDVSASGAADFPVIDLSRGSGDLGDVDVANNIFWGNVKHNGTLPLAIGTSNGGNSSITSASASHRVVNNIDEEGFSSFSQTPGGTVTTNPLFTSPTDFTLQSNSPAVNTGSDLLLPSGITTDLLGNNRTVGRVDRGAYEYDSTLGIEDNELLESFKLYPNPVRNTLNIQVEERLEKVEVYSIQGQKVLESTNSSVNISRLSTGMYLLKILTQNGKVGVKRFIKQ